MSEIDLSVVGYKCKAIIHRAEGTPILFLHGYSYNKEVWQRISITKLLIEKHIPFLALDMPYGPRTACKPRTRDTQTNVTFAKEALHTTFGDSVPILVGASAGGNIALNYSSRYPVKGLLLLAPARALEEKLAKSYDNFKFPVHIIWGTNDNIVSGDDLRTLANRLSNSKLIRYEDAGHSAYIAQPEKFKRDLLELYAAT